MSRRDNAPIGNTCPIIDRVISSMESAKNEAEYILKYPEEDSSLEAKEIISKLETAISDIEEVRDANSALRDWGNEEHDRANLAEEEKEEVLDREELLRDKISDLKKYVNDL